MVFWRRIRRICKQYHHLKCTKRYKIKNKWTFSRDTINWDSQTGLAKSCKKGQPLSTAVYEAESDLRRASSEEKHEARDPDPDVDARQDFWSVMGNYMYRNPLAPRTKLYVPKDGFPIPLNHIDVQRQTKTSIDVFNQATIDDYGNVDGEKSLSDPWICVTRFVLFNTKSTRRTDVGSRQTDKTRCGHIWPEEWSSVSKRSQRKAVNKWAEEKPKSGRSERMTRHLQNPGR